MTTFETPNVGPPATAMYVGEWECGQAGGPTRTLSWASWLDGLVTVDGRQHTDGRVDAHVSVWVGDSHEGDAAQARQLAAALLDAAEAHDLLTTGIQ